MTVGRKKYESSRSHTRKILRIGEKPAGKWQLSLLHKGKTPNIQAKVQSSLHFATYLIYITTYYQLVFRLRKNADSVAHNRLRKSHFVNNAYFYIYRVYQRKVRIYAIVQMRTFRWQTLHQVTYEKIMSVATSQDPKNLSEYYGTELSIIFYQ